MQFRFLTVLIFLAGSHVNAQTGSIDELVSWMSGTFSSAAQAAQDTDYYAISLVMTPIWENRYPGQHWLYVEQSLTTQQDKPYRQRIYQVEALLDGTFSSAVYLLPDEKVAIGKGNESSFFDQWEPEDLHIRDGCAVYLSYSEGVFTGSTRGQDCKSSLKGASYATSEVVLSVDGIVSWDQGFDLGGKRVWGAEKGGYIFDRR